MLAAWGSKREEGKQPVRGMFSFLFLFFLFMSLGSSGLSCSIRDLRHLVPCTDFLAVVHGLGHSEARRIILPQPGIAPMSPFHCKADS